MNSKPMASAAFKSSSSELFLVTEQWSESDAAHASKISLCTASLTLARSLVSCGVGKDSRVGVVMTERPERHIVHQAAAVIGAEAITHDRISSAEYLAAFLNETACSVLLTQRQLNGASMEAMLSYLDMEILDSRPGDLQSLYVPFLRYIALAGTTCSRGAVESWDDFQRRSAFVWPELVQAMAAKVAV